MIYEIISDDLRCDPMSDSVWHSTHSAAYIPNDLATSPTGWSVLAVVAKIGVMSGPTRLMCGFH